jgi:hypothetical protein
LMSGWEKLAPELAHVFGKDDVLVCKRQVETIGQ